MKVYYCKSFTGRYPVGTAAIILANNIVEAKKLLEIELTNHGLEQEISYSQIMEIDRSRPQALILNDGDY